MSLQPIDLIADVVRPVAEDFRTTGPDGYPDPMPDLVTIIQGLVAEHQQARANISYHRFEPATIAHPSAVTNYDEELG